VCERLDLLSDRLGRLIASLERSAPPPAGGYLDAAEVAQLLGASMRSVRTWAANGVLPKPVRFGRSLRWSRSSIEEHARDRSGKRR
jgi:excisionase family DNA binding protein